MPNKTTPKFKLKPCNDPTRDDWSVFSKLLRRTVSPAGMSEAQAASELKKLLIAAYANTRNANSCNELVAAACCPRNRNSGVKSLFNSYGRSASKRLEFFEKIRMCLLMPEDGENRPVAKVNLDRARKRIVDAMKAGTYPEADLNKAEAAVDAAIAKNQIPLEARQAAAEAASVAMRKAGVPIADLDIHTRHELVLQHMAREQAVSSYSMLDYWDPEKCGVLPYVAARVKHIMNAQGKAIEISKPFQSLEALAAAGQEVQRDYDGEGWVVRARNGDLDDSDNQEKHEAGFDPGENSLLAPADEEVAYPGELAVPDEMANGGQLSTSHRSVKMLTRLLDSIDAVETVNNSPLLDPAFMEALATEEVFLGSLRDMQALMAESGKDENDIEYQARVSAELDIADEMVRTLGGISRFPEEVAVRLREARKELSRESADISDDDEAAREIDDNARVRADKSSKQDLAYAFSQSRKQQTALNKPSRPEFELFSQILNIRIVPAESPDARYVQLKEAACLIAATKCSGLDTDADIAVGATIEAAVAEWDPSVSGFGRQFPDVIDHLETEASLAIERKLAAASEAAKSRANANAPTLAPAVSYESGQMDFLQTGAVAFAVPKDVIDGLKVNTAAINDLAASDSRAEVEAVEDIIRDPVLHKAFAIKSVMETSFWTSRCRDREELDSPERIDYQFLCGKLGIVPVTELKGLDLTGDHLHNTVKGMAQKWVGMLVDARRKASGLTARMDFGLDPGIVTRGEQFNIGLIAATNAYDPGKDGFFSQAINEFLRAQMSNDLVRRGLLKPETAKSTAHEGDPSDRHLLAGIRLTPPPTEEDAVAPDAPSKGRKDDYLL